MADLNVLKLKIPTLDGNNAILDIEGFQGQMTTDITAMKGRLDALESGSRQFALKDYSQTANQSEMVVGVYYYVPFDSDNAFIQLDEHGQPTGGKTIHHFDVYMKGSDGVVTKITTQYTDGNLQGVAYTNKKATFEAGIAKSANASTWAEIGATDVVTKGEVNLEVSRLDTAITNITNGTTSITLPDATDSVKGVVTLSDAIDGTENAATGKKAATPKAVADAKTAAVSEATNAAKTAAAAELKKVTDVIGVNAEKAVTVDGDNAFTGDNTFTTGDSTLTVNGEGVSGGADSDLHLGAGETEIVISSSGSITRPAMKGSEGETEIVTKKYVDDKVSTATIPNATTEVAGKVELATAGEITSGTANKVVDAAGLKTVTDAINSAITNITNGTTSITLPDATEGQKGVVQLASTAEVTTGTNTTKAVTAAGVKAALDLKIQVVSDEGQATQAGVLYIITESA